MHWLWKIIQQNIIFGEKSNFLHTFLKLLLNQGKFKSISKFFTFNAIRVSKKVILMYCKPAITCFKYQVFLYNMVQKPSHIWMDTEPAVWIITLPPPSPPHYRHPSPTLYGSITFTHLKDNSCMVKLLYLLKIKGETRMVQEPSHVKQLSPIHMCKIGFRMPD